MIAWRMRLFLNVIFQHPLVYLHTARFVLFEEAIVVTVTTLGWPAALIVFDSSSYTPATRIERAGGTAARRSRWFEPSRSTTTS
jgi:hypothetical protein